ncbi:MAG: DUF4954 family protein [Candidatus Hydrogenedentota bacterium]
MKNKKDVLISGNFIIEDKEETCCGLPVRILAGNEMHREMEVYEDTEISDIKKDAIQKKSIVKQKTSIDNGTIITGSGIIRNCRIGKGVRIDGNVFIENSTILDNAYIGNNVTIKNSLIKNNAIIDTGAIIIESVINSYAEVKHYAIVKNSFIDKGSVVEQAEITASLIGSLTGIHHKSLIIAVRWFEGRGNVGAGALIGSNHTGKAPDQECDVGEGLFFGIGVNIKYPCNFIYAPYTIIATGLTLLPQRLEMPFSLINSPSFLYNKISPAYNEILPGWVIDNGAYIIARNEIKFEKRSRDICEYKSIFREEILREVFNAYKRLCSFSKKKVYTDEDYTGLGKNFLCEDNLFQAINAYKFFIRLCYFIMKAEDRLHNDIAKMVSKVVDGTRQGKIFNDYLKLIKSSKERDVKREKKIHGESIKDLDRDEILVTTEKKIKEYLNEAR